MFDYKIGILVSLSACFFVYINTQGPGSGVGGSCFYPSDCGLWHFLCENGVCRCDDDHIPDRENKWCAVDILKPCGYHDPCFDPNAECFGVAIPKYGTCQCKKGYTLHEKKRICSVVIGNNCSTSEDCIEGNCELALLCQDESANCNYTQCFCNTPLKPDLNGTKCRPGLNDDCSQFNDCAREHSSCNEVDKKKICECDFNYKETTRENVINETETFCLAKLDIRCKNTTDCADNGATCVEKNDTIKLEPPTCKTNRLTFWPDPPIEDPPKYCVCGEGYVRHPDPGPDTLDVSECLLVATEEKDNCTHSIQCTTYSGIGSECLDGNCRCKKGFYFDEDFYRCVRSCLCPDKEDVREIVGVLKDLAPTLELLAKNNDMDISKVLKKIKNLVD